MHGDPITATSTTRYEYVTRLTLHECGHILGLPDFYSHPDTKDLNLDAVMDEARVISDEHDID